MRSTASRVLILRYIPAVSGQNITGLHRNGAKHCKVSLKLPIPKLPCKKSLLQQDVVVTMHRGSVLGVHSLSETRTTLSSMLGESEML
jgi:hypothetical protein